MSERVIRRSLICFNSDADAVADADAEFLSCRSYQKFCDKKIVETFELDIPACFVLMRRWFQFERKSLCASMCLRVCE